MDDLISRQAAIEAIGELCSCTLDEEAMWREIIGRIPSIQQGQQWIPVSEKLPNCNGCYLVWRPHFFGGEIGMPAICYFDGQNVWHDSYGVDFERVLHPDDVTAWMPLPEPYEGEES